MNWRFMVGTRGRAWLGVMAVVSALCGNARADSPAAADLARQSLAECEQGRKLTARSEREAHFQRGQKLAEQAVAADDNNANAHFSLFCNMGELMRIDGETISSVFQLRRLMGELDRTLAIDPHHVDAMSSKGQLLVRLPRLLGGNVQEGEAMLREVIAQDPNAFSSRLALAKTCEARGDKEEALAFTTRALQIAREQGRADKIAEAQAILAQLRADR
jgi:tetratricopeptide (TPR) repeat protein